MTHELKFRYIYGIPGQPETYFEQHFEIEEIEIGDPIELLYGWRLRGDYKIISRDQFTGLKDKKMKDSFSCDLCDYSYYIQNSENPDDFKKYTGTGRILMIDGCFMIEDLKTTNKIPFHYTGMSFEVVSNTHGIK